MKFTPNLENIVNFKKKLKRATAITTLLGYTTLSTIGCNWSPDPTNPIPPDDPPEDPPIENIAPNTYIDDPTINGDSISVQLYGVDPDGEIKGYWYQLDNGSWKKKIGERVTIEESGLQDGSHILKAKAYDDKDDTDKSPARWEFTTETSEQELNVETKITNQNGIVNFNNLEVTVRNEQNNPVSNATVDFIDGENSDLIITSHGNYHSHAKFHNQEKSSAIINLIDTIAEYSIRTVFGTNELTAIRNFLEVECFLNATNTGIPGIDYLGTYTPQEIGQMTQIGINLAAFIGSAVAGGSTEPTIISYLTNSLPLEELAEHLSGDNNFDVYSIPLLSTSNKIFMPSNKPTAELEEAELSGNNVLNRPGFSGGSFT